ncbi:hypothetical protein PanWU01x14_010000, partial [Parasponia andersonii]
MLIKNKKILILDLDKIKHCQLLSHLPRAHLAIEAARVHGSLEDAHRIFTC